MGQLASDALIPHAHEARVCPRAFAGVGIMPKGINPAKHAYRYPAPGMRRCTQCGAVKPFAEFMKNKRVPSGTGPNCLVCKAKQWHKLRPTTLEQQAPNFWKKVDKRGPTECWNWIGGGKKGGYGQFHVLGGNQLAHRVSLMLAGVDVPDRKKTGLVVDHLCNNKRCVNPAHMRITTQRVNSLENNTGVSAISAAVTHCPEGHAYEGANLAIFVNNRRGKQRVCLTCRPTYWRWAVIPRLRPPGSRVKKGETK